MRSKQKKELKWKISGREFDFREGSLVMGILNVTPDSFSDGGRWSQTQGALEHAHRLIAEGADMIDVGGESTRPGSDAVSLDDELARVIPVIEALASETAVPISVDTCKAEVARQALGSGRSDCERYFRICGIPRWLRSARRATAVSW